MNIFLRVKGKPEVYPRSVAHGRWLEVGFWEIGTCIRSLLFRVETRLTNECGLAPRSHSTPGAALIFAGSPVRAHVVPAIGVV
jgi:hypothetical protein